MRDFRTLATVFVAALAIGNFAACDDATEGNTNGGNGGKTDELTGPFACDDFIEDASGRGLPEGFLEGRKDPLAQLVLKPGEDCPTSYAEIMTKLRANDTESCSVDNAKAGISSYVVTETAQLLDMPTNYRVAVTRECDGREEWELFFSLFGVQPDSGLPGNVEVISFDAESKLFNFYVVEGGRWEWHGDSTDMIKPGNEATNRCAACHTAGGLVMKELDTPWVHWEGHLDIPGASELVDANDDLGTKRSGSRMERIVNDGNRAWNPIRMEFWRSQGDVENLIAPLFCHKQVNLDNGADFKDSDMRSVKADFLLDPELKSFGSISIETADYLQALVDTGHSVAGLEDADGEPFRDTVFAFPYPERAKIDTKYVDELEKAGIIDENFVHDVLMVDFTRPLFSEERCALVKFAPTDLEEITVASIKAGFIANLEEKGTDPEGDGLTAAEQMLLDNLSNDEDQDAHETAVDEYWDACAARDKTEFINDTVRVAILKRDLARELHVFEFAATMPQADEVVDISTRFNRFTCELETDDTPGPTTKPEPEPEPEPEPTDPPADPPSDPPSNP